MSASLPAVVVVNYNGGEHLLRCLRALDEQTVPHVAIVVDNASRDGSARAARLRHPNARYLPLRRNTGFARAANVGVTRVESDVFVTLNPDTVPRPDFLEAILEPFSDPAIASVAGTLVFASDPGTIASAGIAMTTAGSALDARLGFPRDSSVPTSPVFGASGGAAAYRTSAFRAAGGFCEPFFMYLEDADLAWRLRLAGWDSRWAPAAVATHVYSATSGEGSAFKRRLLSRNRIWLLARCLPGELWRRHRGSIARFDLAALAWGLAHRDGALLCGRAEGVAGLPARLCERRSIQRDVCVPVDSLAAMLVTSPTAVEMLRLRRLTSRLAGSDQGGTPA